MSPTILANLDNLFYVFADEQPLVALLRGIMLALPSHSCPLCRLSYAIALSPQQKLGNLLLSLQVKQPFVAL